MTVQHATNPSSTRMVGYSATYVRLWSVLVSILDALGAEFELLRPQIQETMSSFLVTDMPDWRLPWWEEMLGLSQGDNLTRQERESRILGRLQAWQRPTPFNLHELANAYPYGEIEPIMDPDTWVMTYRFISTVGRPTNIDDLRHELLRATDAHVGIKFEYRYLLWGELRQSGTLWHQLKDAAITWDVLRNTSPDNLPPPGA